MSEFGLIEKSRRLGAVGVLTLAITVGATTAFAQAAGSTDAGPPLPNSAETVRDYIDACRTARSELDAGAVLSPQDWRSCHALQAGMFLGFKLVSDLAVMTSSGAPLFCVDRSVTDDMIDDAILETINTHPEAANFTFAELFLTALREEFKCVP
jgi:hypothetical protein